MTRTNKPVIGGLKNWRNLVTFFQALQKNDWNNWKMNYIVNIYHKWLAALFIFVLHLFKHTICQWLSLKEWHYYIIHFYVVVLLCYIIAFFSLSFHGIWINLHILTFAKWLTKCKPILINFHILIVTMLIWHYH